MQGPKEPALSYATLGARNLWNSQKSSICEYLTGYSRRNRQAVLHTHCDQM